MEGFLKDTANTLKRQPDRLQDGDEEAFSLTKCVWERERVGVDVDISLPLTTTKKNQVQQKKESTRKNQTNESTVDMIEDKAELV